MSIIGSGFCYSCNTYNCFHMMAAQQQMNGINQYNNLMQQAQLLNITTNSTGGNISIANPNSVSVPSTVIKEKKVDKRLLLL